MIVRLQSACSTSLLGAAVAAVLFAVPHAASAAIFIHEIAWMGTAASADNEWIELFNDAAGAVDLTDWTLTGSDGVTLSITFGSGKSIPAGGYFLLERTDDDAVPAVAADQIYSGALANGGGTLTLRRADTGIEDSIAGGASWAQIGGDNTTKHTAQWTSAGWVTAQATPGAQNASEGAAPDDEDDEDVDDAETIEESEDGGSNVRISLVPTPRTPGLMIEGVVSAHAGGEVSLRAIPAGISPKLAPSVVYEWNFGDGTTGAGKEVAHTYAFPGMYAVTVRAHFAQYEAHARATVTVLPIDLSLERGSEGQLFMHNDSLNDMDVSGYRIVDDPHSFSFPPRTFILSHGTITLAPSLLEQTHFSESVFIRTGDGRHITLGARKADDTEIVPPSPAPLLSVASTLEPELAVEETDMIERAAPVVLGGQTASASDSATVPPWVTYGGLGVVIMLGIAALFFRGGPQ